ncbi:PREDICTED: WD repeat-containing protein 44 [Tarenaya hassleriana]|uniref:WD repeat-containing protein 44 n=1 Tax=Tarenaya hassleriana TaxID=28532 RepID=UPI0008FD5A47|nr:PREDICTED: WD repeat-containing protein 44 [Tarenaya hassleriana]
MSPDYDIWMAAPGSVRERRRRLLSGMGLESKKNMLGSVFIQRVVSTKLPPTVKLGGHDLSRSVTRAKREGHYQKPPVDQRIDRFSPMPVLLVRSRSQSDIEMNSADKSRKEEMLGKTSKSRLTRTMSMIVAPCARICPCYTPARELPEDAQIGQPTAQRSGAFLSSAISKTRFDAFLLIKNLDTGKEFVVKESGENGMWNRLSDLQTGKQLTMEEFEKSVGYSPAVKELMRRENVTSSIDSSKINSYVSKSLRISKKTGAALLKNIKDVAHSMSLRVSEKEPNGNANGPNSPKETDQKHAKSSDQSNQWVKVRQSGYSHKELSALHMSQDIQAHKGAIWTMKFSLDAHWLASAGEDRTVLVWEVQDCEIMSMNEGNLTPLHPSMSGLLDRSPAAEDVLTLPSEKKKKKKGKNSAAKKGSQIPEYVHVPETVFSLSDKPICSLSGHLDDVLDLSWSRSQQLLSSSMDKTVRLWDIETQSCLKLFAHNDYVTCIQFNPLDEDYFISGSLDGKVRIWNIPNRQVVEWSDINEMVTAVCYAPDGQAAFVGSHKGNCRLYSAEECKLEQTNQIDMQYKKKAQAKKITGFQFSPINPSEVLVTSADSRIRILNGTELTHKFKGFRNTSSQIAAYYTQDAKHIVSASEDAQVYVWKHEERRPGIISRRATTTVPTSSSYESFACKDVSVAVPWNGVVKGEPPPVGRNGKKPAGLPPLPKKNNDKNTEGEETDTEMSCNEAENNNGESLSSSSSSSISSRLSSWSWFDGSGGHGSHSVQPTAWGMVIVTATVTGQIRAYQNFGVPRRVSRQGSLFSYSTS